MIEAVERHVVPRLTAVAVDRLLAATSAAVVSVARGQDAEAVSAAVLDEVSVRELVLSAVVAEACMAAERAARTPVPRVPTTRGAAGPRPFALPDPFGPPANDVGEAIAATDTESARPAVTALTGRPVPTGGGTPLFSMAQRLNPRQPGSYWRAKELGLSTQPFPTSVTARHGRRTRGRGRGGVTRYDQVVPAAELADLRRDWFRDMRALDRLSREEVETRIRQVGINPLMPRWARELERLWGPRRQWFERMRADGATRATDESALRAKGFSAEAPEWRLVLDRLWGSP